jgi:hypothetical protein
LSLNIWIVSDQHNHRIQVFRLSDGSFLRTIGTPASSSQIKSNTTGGLKRGPEDGELRFPTDCLLDARHGLLYVCDRGNARVQVFCAGDGSFVGLFGQRPLPLTAGSLGPASSTQQQLGSSSSNAALLMRKTTSTAGQSLVQVDTHALLLNADTAAAFVSPMAFAKPLDPNRAEVWVADCDAMRVSCWGAFQP